VFSGKDIPFRIYFVLRLLPFAKYTNGVVSLTPAARTSSVALLKSAHGQRHLCMNLPLTSSTDSDRKLCRLASGCCLGLPLNSIYART
jgi:hypothetical protein